MSGLGRGQSGTGATIAIIDDGGDIDHPDFATPRKIVTPRDSRLGALALVAPAAHKTKRKDRPRAPGGGE